MGAKQRDAHQGLRGRVMTLSDADKMIASFPPGMTIPDELVLWFRWLDDQGLYRGFDGGGFPHALIDPADRRALMYVTPADTELSRLWTETSDNPDDHRRLAPFFRLGGDGTYAALWRDNDGTTQIVGLGSGSGSPLAGILSDNPVDFLRLVAIGYEELSFPELYDRTPREIYQEQFDDIADAYDDEEALQELGEFVLPERLRAWVTTTFGVTIPERASEILGSAADREDDASDPFWRWDHAMGKWR